MKTLLLQLLTFMCVVSAAFADDPYPRQPKLQAAHKSLMAAKGHLQRSLQGREDKHFQEAGISLSAALTNLENAAKNKGSNRLAAIREIKAAQAEIAPSKGVSRSVSTAIQHVEQAIKEVAESARAGRK